MELVVEFLFIFDALYHLLHLQNFLYTFYRLNNIQMQNNFLKQIPRMAEITLPTNYLNWKSKQFSLPINVNGAQIAKPIGRRDHEIFVDEPNYLLVRSDDANPHRLGITVFSFFFFFNLIVLSTNPHVVNPIFFRNTYILRNTHTHTDTYTIRVQLSFHFTNNNNNVVNLTYRKINVSRFILVGT